MDDVLFYPFRLFLIRPALFAGPYVPAERLDQIYVETHHLKCGRIETLLFSESKVLNKPCKYGKQAHSPRKSFNKTTNH